MEIEYIVHDVLELGQIGSFDLVVATYLLNYAQTKEQLFKMCQTIYTNLKPDNRFVSINDNLELPHKFYPRFEKYGVAKSISGLLQEGTLITITYTNLDGQKFSFDNYYLSKDTYEWAFRTAGFKEVCWHQPLVSPQGAREFGKQFWQDCLDYAPIVGIECWK